MCVTCPFSPLAPGALISCSLKKDSQTPRGLVTLSSGHCCWSHGLHHVPGQSRASRLCSGGVGLRGSLHYHPVLHMQKMVVREAQTHA